MSPILKERFLYARRNHVQDVKLIDVDLCKSDIYSLGITFLQAATNININDINESEDHMETCEKALQKTNLPQIIQNTIMHMLTYDEKQRINTYSLVEVMYDCFY